MFGPTAGLQLKIVAEDKIIENKINDILQEWEQTHPVQGSMRADTAMNTINVFKGKLTRIQDKYGLVCRAKEALDLELARHTRLELVFEELRDLKAVWTALLGIRNLPLNMCQMCCVVCSSRIRLSRTLSQRR